MSPIVDNLLAFRIVKMLVTPFTDTAAYKLGIIDAKGKNVRPARDLKTEAEREAYNYLTRLVFNMKKIINRLPGGESRLKSLVAALWLVKEQYENKNRPMYELQEKFDEILKMMDNRVSLVEEEIIVNKFLKEDGMGAGLASGAGASTGNVTGAMVSTNEPKIYKKDVTSYKKRQPSVIAGMARRPKPLS
jgi:hypothetical protein